MSAAAPPAQCTSGGIEAYDPRTWSRADDQQASLWAHLDTVAAAHPPDKDGRQQVLLFWTACRESKHTLTRHCCSLSRHLTSGYQKPVNDLGEYLARKGATRRFSCCWFNPTVADVLEDAVYVNSIACT